MSYFITPKYSVAFNAKVASSTLSRAIIRDFYPDIESIIQKASYPQGKNPENAQGNQFLCPKEINPSKPIVLIMRDPTDRFVSSMNQLGLQDIDHTLDCLTNKALIYSSKRQKNINLYQDIHFKKQKDLLVPSVDYYIFKLDQLDRAALFIGLGLPLPRLNISQNRLNITLHNNHKDRILAYYHDDSLLYQQI